MKKYTRILFLIVAMLLVASLALAACNPETETPPGHVCRHLCNVCDKCTDKSCTDPECADKCEGHGLQGGGDEHECESKCETCQGCTNAACEEDACKNKCTGNHNSEQKPDTPVEPDIKANINGSIFHRGNGTVGEIELYSNGYGALTLSNQGATEFTSNFVTTAITYTITSSGVFTIWTAPDSHIKTPAVGKVEGRTVSVTVTNSLNGNETSYEFKSTLNMVTVKNLLGKGETNVYYYPEGYATDMSATLKDYTLDYALVGGVAQTNSQLRNFTVPSSDVTIEYFWTQTSQAGNYTIVYKPGEGTGTPYTDHANSSLYKVLSLYTMTSPSNDNENDEPTYVFDFQAPAGKYFMGWLIEGTQTVVKNGDTISLTAENTALVAQWGANVTVTLNGFTGTGISGGVYSNLERNDWVGSYAEGFTQQFSPSYKFVLPTSNSQFVNVIYVACNGHVLLGWQCSEHDEIHAPGEEHKLTADVTFTAKWARDDGTTALDGSYTAITSIDLESNGYGVIVRAEIANKKLTLYNTSGEATLVIDLITFTSNSVSGERALWTYTATLEGGTLTITVKAGNTVKGTGTFSRES